MVFGMFQGELGSEIPGGVPRQKLGLWGVLEGSLGMWCRGGILLRGLEVGVVGRCGGSVFGSDRELPEL